MPQITIGPNAEAGVYIGTLVKVGDPYDKTWADGTTNQQMDWAWLLPNGEPVRESTSTATGVKSKTYERLVALRGGKAPSVGERIELNDYAGYRAILTIEINANGYPKVKSVGAIPTEMLQQSFAAATGAPVSAVAPQQLHPQPAAVEAVSPLRPTSERPADDQLDF